MLNTCSVSGGWRRAELYYIDHTREYLVGTGGPNVKVARGWMSTQRSQRLQCLPVVYYNVYDLQKKLKASYLYSART